MKTKIFKFTIVITLLLVSIVLYKLPVISLWRNYNNGIRAFSEKNFEQAAIEFQKAIIQSDDPILKYNHCISLWSNVLRIQKDMKINTIKDTSLSDSKRKELLSKIEKTHEVIKQTLNIQTLGNKRLAKLYYAQGKLFLLQDQLESARQALIKSNSKDKNFISPLRELVKLKSSPQFDPTDELLLNNSEPETLELIKGWKPF